MKDQNLYRVTVYGTFCKDVLVYGESEEDAIDYVQDICDNTNLITFGAGDLVDLAAEDAIDLEDDGCDHDCDNCPAVACAPTFVGSIKPNGRPKEVAVTGAPLLHIPTQDLTRNAPSQPVKEDEKAANREHVFKLMGEIVDLYSMTCEDFDALRETVLELLDECSQQSKND